MPHYRREETPEVKARKQTLDERVREVAQRGRAAHADPTVRVSYVEPWSLKPRPEVTPSSAAGRMAERDDRRSRVLGLLRSGTGTERIAEMVGVSVSTVRRYRREAEL